METSAAAPREPIYVDSRVGSKDLYPLFLKRQVPVELVPLPYGDACFVGRGPSGPEVIGVERKRIRDLVASLVSDRLMGHQLPGLVDAYRFRWVVVEGVYRTGASGYLEVPRGRGDWGLLEPRLLGAGLDGWLLTLQLRGGTFVQRTRDAEDTADWLSSLHAWWTGKAWHEHQGHLALPPQIDGPFGTKPSLLRKVAATLPGIGFERSADVEQAFVNVVDLVMAEEARWRTIKGIGPVLARGIVEALRAKTSSTK